MNAKLNSKALEVINNIKQRRSLPAQHMKSDPIDRETLELLLEMANWAPTHKFTEPWRFRVYLEDGRASLAHALGETYTRFIGDKYDERKFQKTIGRPVHVPVVMAIIMSPGQKAKLPEWEEVAAVACAVQNIHLAAQSMDIGCFWSSPKYLADKGLREFLELADHEKCLGFYYLGYPVDSWPKTKRRPMEEKVVWVDQ